MCDGGEVCLWGGEEQEEEEEAHGVKRDLSFVCARRP